MIIERLVRTILAQVQAINYLLKTKDYKFITDNGLSEDFFSDYSREFKFIQNHYKQYGSVPDSVTLLKVFPDFDLTDVNETPTYLVSELRREKTETFLVKVFNKVKDLLVAGKTDDAMSLFLKASQKSIDSTPLNAVNILEDTTRYDEYLDKCSNFNKYYISTGFKELDDSFGGGIDKQNAYFIISARPGIGKTLVMVKFITAAVEQGLRVGMYEGEMTINKIAGRYDTLVSHISNTAINRGGSSISDAYRTYLDYMKRNHKGEFFVLTRENSGSDKVTVDTLRAFVEKYNLDILFIDQLSLLDSTSKSTKSFEQIADISKELKILQVQKKIPIVAASQLNRLTLDDSIGTQNIAGSDRISQDCTEMIALSKDNNTNTMNINIAKARDGAKKWKLSYIVDFDKGEFDYIPEGEEDEDGSSPVYTSSNEEEDVF